MAEMSELKAETIVPQGSAITLQMYPKGEADAYIAEKDQALEFAKALILKDIEIIKEKDKEIAELKAQLESEKASRYAESVDAGMRERRLKRALYKVCANWACAKIEYEQFDSNVFMFGVTTTDKEVSWESMMKKCQAKAEEYK